MAKHTTHLLLQNVDFGTAWQTRHWRPHADVYRTENVIAIVLEIAGVDEADLRLRFEPGLLAVEGQRALLPLPPDSKCLQVEISHGRFHREFKLPRDADGDNISASVKNGLLLITIPFKVPEPAATVKVTIS